MIGQPPLILGIDLGTTNGKVACYDSNGKLLSKVEQKVTTYYPLPGVYEQYPDEWITILEKLINLTVRNLGSNVKRIQGISLSSWGPGIVIIGGGKPLTPTPTWQDKRCWDQGQELIENIGLDWIGFGTPQTGFYARLYWNLYNRHDLKSEIDYFFDIKGFLLFWLTGKAITDPSSGPSEFEWNKEVLNYIGCPIEKLPFVKDSTENVGFLKDELASKLGLPLKIPIFTGLNDGASATLGSGVIDVGDSIISLGTNGVVRSVIQKRLDPKLLYEHSLFSWPYINKLWICGGQTLSGAESINWFNRIIGNNGDLTSIDKLVENAIQSPIGSKGIIFLPYLSGRGSPNVDLSMKASFLNLRIDHKQSDITRSILEGVSFALVEIYDVLRSFGVLSNKINITGGGANSDLWQQIIADLMDKTIINAGGDSTLGSAIVASVGLGIYDNYSDAVKKMVHYKKNTYPIKENINEYNNLRKRFQSIRDLLCQISTN